MPLGRHGGAGFIGVQRGNGCHGLFQAGTHRGIAGNICPVTYDQSKTSLLMVISDGGGSGR